MYPPDIQTLLRAWEAGYSQRPELWALTMLSLSSPQLTVDALARFSVGKRDVHLLELRESIFGSKLASIETCPQCKEKLEFEIDSATLLAQSQMESPPNLSIQADDYHVTFRLPDTLDLIATDGCRDVTEARNILLERCVENVFQSGNKIAATKLPESVVCTLVESMAKADPQADLQMSLACPSCRHEWNAMLDIIPFFWRELNAWAHRVLREVHLLASAYCWAEEEILSMSPSRRQFYLRMVG